jgi:type IV pilus assembly protein PilA
MLNFMQMWASLEAARRLRSGLRVHSSNAKTLARRGIHRQGGVRMRGRRGFTLIELLIVVVIIGILAAIAIPKFGATKNRAYVSAMKTDLRNLVTAEESYFYDYAAYTTTLATTTYRVTSGVTLTIALAAPGWAATATHNQLPGKPCYIIGGGNTAANSLATSEGEVKCTP